MEPTEQQGNVSAPGTADTGLRSALLRLFGQMFYVDLRSLAAVRIGIGLVIIGDLATRARHLTAHYTDLGAAPRELVQSEYGFNCYLSLHWWFSGSITAVAALFVFHGIVAALLAAGWRTRIMNAICWYLLTSLHLRLPLLHSAGDTTLQLLLFWGLFLPLATRWSLDARRRGRLGGGSAASNTYVSVAGSALLLQVAFIYVFAALSKLTTPMWRDGTAIAFAVNLDSYTTSVAVWLRQYEGILKTLTLMTLAWEILGSLLAFIPGVTTIGRIVAVIGFWLLQIAFGLCFNLGIFAYISAVAWLAFIPGPVWDRILPSSSGCDAAAPHAPKLQDGRILNVVAGAFLALVFVLNVRALHSVTRKMIPRPIAQLGNVLRLRQDWSMFTNERYTGWFVVQAELADGREIDLIDGTPLTWDRPAVPAEHHGTARWTQFLFFSPVVTEPSYWVPYGEYLCRTWNDRLEDRQRVERLTLWFVKHEVDMFRQDQYTRILLHEQNCGAGP